MPDETLTRPPAAISEEAIEGLFAGSRRVRPQGTGNQSKVWIFADHDPPLVVKTPRSRGVGRWLSRWMIRREYRAYERLEGVPGVPHCYGLFRGEWLVLSYEPGVKIRPKEVQTPHATTPAPSVVGLRRTIAEMHRRGVAHTDLKRHDNLLYSAEHERITVTDFGTALLRPKNRPPGPVWRWAAQQDWNAWARYGWSKHPEFMPPAIARLHRRTLVERVAKSVRDLFSD
ncbi:serine/threonine-protein kinase [Halorhodospira halophila]|uniref:Protein kinase domain-containing protein n=1 Tax=Halorhodospira halophila (strain DSM 244 / SL1) TaxID=349124 RepID=A1WZJ8_HALHL|nr:serine/threonine-protein kinase [Halorhodospira halophila]ABM63110.1 hypothetical protein Hhal_2347 [Halorhodospira halophila SL1]MBK1729288.1 hypothetical protein [Halorhodospira halophila]